LWLAIRSWIKVAQCYKKSPPSLESYGRAFFASKKWLAIRSPKGEEWWRCGESNSGPEISK